MFCFALLFQKSVSSLSIWSLCFVLPPRFCVPECHRNIVESAEKVLSVSVSSFASEGKPKRRRQLRSSRSPKELLKQVKVRVEIDL